MGDTEYFETQFSEFEAIPGTLLDADGNKVNVIVRVFKFPGDGDAVRVVMEDEDGHVNQQLWVNADKLRARVEDPSTP